MSKEDLKIISDIVEDANNKLAQYCDAVQILVSFAHIEGTSDLFKGTGNWYARQGMAQEFLNRDQAQVSAVELSKVINSEE